MNDGIPVNGAVILIGKQRLLVVITDLTCCGNGPQSWEELRRRVEASEIRRLLQQILERYGLESSTVGRTGSHRPLVVEYSWK